MSTKTVRWSVAKLQPHYLQARVFQDLPDGELEALAEDIRVNGLRDPIEITPQGLVICGHQRLRAVKLLGWKYVTCIVRHDLAEQGAGAIERRLIDDNLSRRQLSRLGVLRACRALMELVDKKDIEGTTLRDYVAKRFGMSGRTLDRHLKVLEAPMGVQSAWERRKLTDAEVNQVLNVKPTLQNRIDIEIRKGHNPKKVVHELADAARPRSRPTPDAKSRLLQAVKALVALRDSLPRRESDWPIEELREFAPQVRQGRRLLRRISESCNPTADVA